MGDTVVQAIDGYGVLNEIVCADAEEADFAGKVVGHKNGAGSLDHDSNFDPRVERNSFA